MLTPGVSQAAPTVSGNYIHVFSVQARWHPVPGGSAPCVTVTVSVTPTEKLERLVVGDQRLTGGVDVFSRSAIGTLRDRPVTESVIEQPTGPVIGPANRRPPRSAARASASGNSAL
jgi:hypothetical protein